ncbi:hypothetical protein APS56_16230 [Pseudalgibacter alginicilyticus]|uniref:Deoxyribose-phosphate aldolase n=1 Tax=Pseudalgibacter alginicilyticus TaxID=1736674 RepID=A0A0P0DEL5_9FLAO|nr:DUF6503 family protein [Pseudalgibacter alginicilyticus]ALJ06586.1 hypothetical protein APS56_16230 [Pseudalgibacter alginicilyticus]
MKLLVSAFLCVLFFSCHETTKDTATDIVNDAIVEAGGTAFETSKVTFVFRDKLYQATRTGGLFKLEQQFVSEGDTIHNVLTNTKFTQFVNSKEQVLNDTLVSKYKNALNSVHYFSVLPYGLNAEAVNKVVIGEVEIKGDIYQKIKVTFNEIGGGDDFDDVFMYWFHKEKKTTDYLAYKYHTNGGGIRFREAKNVRRINTLLIADYNNYKPKTSDIDFYNIDRLFNSGELELLSEINLENVQVEIL